MNTFGENFRVTLFGESHGSAIGVVMDGVPAGIPLSISDFTAAISRRRWGDSAELSKATTSRKEEDAPEILSGVYNNKTTGAPLAIIFKNKSQRSTDYSKYKSTPRPGHADFVAIKKFGGFGDERGGGHFSGRLTLNIVAAGVVAQKIAEHKLKGKAPVVKAVITEIGGEQESGKWGALLDRIIKEGDSVGGIIECRATGLPIGIGEPFFNSLESEIAHLLFSIPGVKGVEFGDFSERADYQSFASARMRGSEYNDVIKNTKGTTLTNHCGGINGGISNGNPVLFRVAIRPTASIARPQSTINIETGKREKIEIKGRHDVCFALRCPVIIEAITAIAIASLLS